MDQVRLGIIGAGVMARGHIAYFEKVSRLKFTAIADTSAEALSAITSKHEVKGFKDGVEMMESGLIDAVLIATPHYSHPTLSMAAFERGLHVLTEKPVAVTAKDAAEVNDAHKRYPKLVYAAMFNMRTNPAWKKVKELASSGELGALRRVSWIITEWFRSQAYYDSGGWRGTWKGEGGGVLINQCPHNLDLLQWFTGMPSRVQATVGIGKHHHIEVEDEVNALLEYSNGATGVFITTTAEAPGTNRLEIAGENGKLIADGSNVIQFIRNDVPVTEWLNKSKAAFAKPPHSKMTIEVPAGEKPEHMLITQNFVNAILDGEKVIAPGEEGLNGLELGNAMLMSGILQKPVNIPTDRQAFADLIKELGEKSRFQKRQLVAMV